MTDETTLNKYPCLAKAILTMVYDNGGVHIMRPEEGVNKLIEECFVAEGVYASDLEEINLWIGGMEEDTYETFIGGEESDALAVFETAPAIQGDGTVYEMILRFYEHAVGGEVKVPEGAKGIICAAETTQRFHVGDWVSHNGGLIEAQSKRRIAEEVGYDPAWGFKYRLAMPDGSERGFAADDELDAWPGDDAALPMRSPRFQGGRYDG